MENALLSFAPPYNAGDNTSIYFSAKSSKEELGLSKNRTYPVFKNTFRICYNCQSGLHGECAFAFCECPLRECVHSQSKILIGKRILKILGDK